MTFLTIKNKSLPRAIKKKLSVHSKAILEPRPVENTHEHNTVI